MAFGLFLFGWFVGLGWTTATAAWLAGYGLWGLSAKHGSEFGLQFLNLFGHLNGTLQVLKGRGNHGSASFVMRRTAAGKGNLSRAEADSPLAPAFLARVFSLRFLHFGDLLFEDFLCHPPLCWIGVRAARMDGIQAEGEDIAAAKAP